MSQRLNQIVLFWTLRDRGGGILHLDCDHQARLLEIKGPGTGSSISVEPNDSTAGSLSSCIIQSPLQSRKGPRDSNWALRARRGHKGDAWFAPPLTSAGWYSGPGTFEIAAGFGWCISRWLPPSNRSVRPKCWTQFQRLDFHGVRLLI